MSKEFRFPRFLLQCYSRNINFSMRLQIDRLVIISKPHTDGIAHHQRERRVTAYCLRAAGGTKLRENRLSVFISNFNPRFLVKLKPDFATSDLLRDRLGFASLLR